MKHLGNGALLGVAALVALATASSASADVKAGVDAWAKGDYAAAVHEWQAPAATGDADAMFNLAQAYRLGRGVAADPVKAEELYARAAAKGHLQAADTYGLMLFQDGRREAALPYVQDAARRGDPRSEYILGIASFNGDLVPKDWVKGYALLTLANAQGLPQATAALAQMDQHVPLAQRQQAAGLALDMQKQADAARGRALAAADLGAGVSTGTASQAAGPAAHPPSSTAVASPVLPEPKIAISPSVSGALDAVAQARQATGTESPSKAGASYVARAPEPAAQVAHAPSSPLGKPPAPAPKPAAQVANATPSPLAKPPAPAPKPATEAVTTSAQSAKPTAPKSAAPKSAAVASVPAEGPWRVQLGAFSVRGNADRLWTKLSTRSELAGRSKLTVPAGAVTKLQAGGYPDRDAAQDACRSLKRAGQDCLVTR